MRTHLEQQKMKNPSLLKIKKKQIKPLQAFKNNSSPISTLTKYPYHKFKVFIGFFLFHIFSTKNYIKNHLFPFNSLNLYFFGS
jgi:hypothetical protein